jgi:serine/threonine protein kinase/tetratricopeptide (TPR) repeat protein
MEPLASDDPRQVGAYQLQARLGADGMGRVFLGRSPAGRSVAVKLVHPELARDPEFRERFRREVSAAQAVSGAFTAPVVAAGPDDDPPWLATAFVAGPSLGDVISEAGPLPEETVWRLAGGLVEALQAVHACGLVHRDLKPGNVLIAADGPRVIDFGIAKAMDGTALTASHVIIGTPVFMAPEQARGGLPGAAGDVFSLGSVLAYAATGRAPFTASDPVAMMYRIVHDEPDLGGLAPSLRKLVAGCLAKDPASRPPLDDLLGSVVAGLASYPATSPTAFWPDPLARMIVARQYTPRTNALFDTGPRPSSSLTPSGSHEPPTTHEPTVMSTARPSARGAEATRTIRPGQQASVPAGLAETGDRLCDEGRYAEAESAYRAAIAASPDFAYAHASLAAPLCAMGRYAEADTACRVAIQLAPSSALGHENLGYVFSKQGMYEEASAAYREVIRLMPGDPDGYNGLGDALRLQARPAEAEMAYRQAIRLDPGSAISYNNLGSVLFEMDLDDDAAAAYREAIRLDPGDPDGYKNLGDVLFEMNLHDEAETAYRQAIRVEPFDPDGHSRLGELLHATGRRKEAAAEFRAARRLKAGRLRGVPGGDRWVYLSILIARQSSPCAPSPRDDESVGHGRAVPAGVRPGQLPGQRR